MSRRSYRNIFSAPTVITTSSGSITASSATLYGNITSSGGANISGKGFYYSTYSDALNGDITIISGGEIGPFSSVITGLSPNTTYYYKAYAINSVGTGIGNVLNFTTSAGAPRVSCQVDSYTISSVTILGTVESDGGVTVTERGVCWNTTGNPTLSDTYRASGSGTGSFSITATRLVAGVTYYFRAYAINSVGTSYSEEVSVLVPAEMWELVFDAPFSTTLTDSINSKTGSTTNATYCASSAYRASLDSTNHYLQKTTQGMTNYKNLVYFIMSSTQYSSKFTAANKIKITYDIYTTFISGSGIEWYATPVAFGRMSSSSNTGNKFDASTINCSALTSGGYITYNTWYSIETVLDFTTSPFQSTTSNGTNTTTTTFTTDPRTNSTYKNYITMFPKQSTSTQAWAGRIKNLKIYVM